MADKFYPGMKVKLGTNAGVVLDKDDDRGYGVIQWDTNPVGDPEDWRGLWGSFKRAGGVELGSTYPFRWINDNGGVKWLKEK